MATESEHMDVDVLGKVRLLFTALEGVTERTSHGEPSWFFKDKKQIATWADHHHDDRVALWCAAPSGVQEALVASDPERYFRPPYVGHRGWVGIYFDVVPDWDTVATIVKDGYACIARKT